MNERLLYDIIAEKKAQLWSSIEDSINEIPDIVAELKTATSEKDTEELLCVSFEKFGSSCEYIKESAIAIAALEDIEGKVKRKLPDTQVKLSDGESKEGATR